MAFQAYANNDLVAVDETDNVNDLKKKLKSGDRKVIVTTIQKLQRLITKRLQEDTPEYRKIRNLRFQNRSEQLDLVIVVDRLLTGFDAPCMSAIFIDRQPMGFHDLIQAFSRTNRIYDKNKAYGQIVTFQAPVLFKKCVDEAVKLYSAGGTKAAAEKALPKFKYFAQMMAELKRTLDEEIKPLTSH